MVQKIYSVLICVIIASLVALLLSNRISVMKAYIDYTIVNKTFRSNTKTNSPKRIRNFSTVPGGMLTAPFRTLDTQGLGNRLFELASVLGIAKKLNRKAVISIQHAKKNAIVIPFNQGVCCMYVDLEEFAEKTEKFQIINLDGDYFQSYKYFNDIRDTVRKMFYPTEMIQKKVDLRVHADLAEKFVFTYVISELSDFLQIETICCTASEDSYCLMCSVLDKNEANYNLQQKSIRVRINKKICVHVRRGDFIGGRHQPSTPLFTVEAVRYLYRKYQTLHSRTAVYVLGNDPRWTKNIFAQEMEEHEIRVVQGTSAEEDLYFSSQYCDVVLITAPTSTFGFWLGYLSKNGSSVYYHDILASGDDLLGWLKPNDFFPEEWIKLRMGGDVVEIH